MKLIEQLQKGKIAIEAHGKYEDVQRVLDVAFPQDKSSDICTDHDCWLYFFGNKDRKWRWDMEDVIPKGMKAVHIDEFIKELDKEKERSTEMAKEYNNSGVSMVPLSQYEAEKELRIKAEAQLKELQPYDRGSEGWGKMDSEDWSYTVGVYLVCINGVHLIETRLGVIKCIDFTTENPHKKETVWESDIHSNNWDKWSKKGAIFIRRRNTIIVHSICTRENTAYFRFTQIGDDLQAKFDDEENLKYIDLTK